MSVEFTVIFALVVYVATLAFMTIDLRGEKRAINSLALTLIVSAVFITVGLFRMDAGHLFGLFVAFSCSWVLFMLPKDKKGRRRIFQPKSDDTQAPA